jgi:hypothetical protein
MYKFANQVKIENIYKFDNHPLKLKWRTKQLLNMVIKIHYLSQYQETVSCIE